MPLQIISTEAEEDEGKPKWNEIFKCLSSNSSIPGGTGRPEDRNCPFSKHLKLEIISVESGFFSHIFLRKKRKQKISVRQEPPVLPCPGNFAWRCIFLPLICLEFTLSLAAALCDFLCLKLLKLVFVAQNLPAKLCVFQENAGRRSITFQYPFLVSL